MSAFDPKLTSPREPEEPPFGLPARRSTMLSYQASGAQMKRREFITFVGSIVAAWPMAAHAQQTRKIPRIGYLMDRSGPPGVLDEGFLAGLREHGYVVGQNVDIEYRWTEGKSERLPALARELVASKVDIIIVAGSESTRAAKMATATIPIVMASSQDAVGMV